MSEPALKPPFTYFGGKTTHARRIAALLPRHGHYVEPYCGSLAVLLAKSRSGMETVNDLDRALCVGPDTRILTADLRWVKAGGVRVGDRLLGFDEHNGPASPGLRAPSRYRHWQLADVTAVKRIKKPAYRLTFDDGTTVVASEDHMWLGGSHATGGRGWRWQSTKGLVCNRRTQRSWILKVADVVEPEDSRESGWLAGFYDGEGNVISAGVRRAGWRISVAQKLGPEADYCERLLKERGFSVGSQLRTFPDKAAWQDVQTLTLGGGMPEVLRFLMQIRPERLVRNFVSNCAEQASLYGRSHQAVGLISKEFLGEQEVMAIETTSHTYVAEGLASHNCTFWRVLRERPADLARRCALTPHSLAEFRDAEDVDAAGDDLEVARRIWVRLTQGRAGTLCSTGWRHFVDPADSSFGMPDYLTGYVARMAAAAERLQHVSLECRQAVELVEWYGRSEDVLLYVDPPYLRSTRNSGAYRHEMSEADHRDLAVALSRARAAVVLSGYASDLYDLELYPGWQRTAFTSGTGQNAETWGNRTEVLWSNRPFPQGTLFDDLEAS